MTWDDAPAEHRRRRSSRLAVVCVDTLRPGYCGSGNNMYTRLYNAKFRRAGVRRARFPIRCACKAPVVCGAVPQHSATSRRASPGVTSPSMHTALRATARRAALSAQPAMQWCARLQRRWRRAGEARHGPWDIAAHPLSSLDGRYALCAAAAGRKRGQHSYQTPPRRSSRPAAGHFSRLARRAELQPALSADRDLLTRSLRLQADLL